MDEEIFRSAKVYLIVLVGVFASVMGVWWLGGFEPNPSIANCNLPAGFECIDFTMSPTGAVIHIQSHEEVDIEKIQLDGCEVVRDVHMEGGQRKLIRFDCRDTETPDRDITFSYKENEIAETGIGSITGVAG